MAITIAAAIMVTTVSTATERVTVTATGMVSSTPITGIKRERMSKQRNLKWSPLKKRTNQAVKNYKNPD